MTEILKYAPQFPGGLRRAWQDLDAVLEKILVTTGGVPINVIDSSAAVGKVKPVAVPPPASFNVIGLDGKFLTFITAPQGFVPQSVDVARNQWARGINVGNFPILHHLQSATSLNFDAASNLKDYGTGPQLLWTDQDPNITRFFRLQSSYDGVNWNVWQVFSSPLTCGPVGVASGLLRTAALTQVNAAYTPTTQPLTAATGGPVNAATINVAPFQVKYPSSISPATNNLVSYNSGSITPLLDSTKYYVYCLDPTYAGGAQTYIASVNNLDVTSNEAVVFLGTITTPAHGGGGTGGSGGGGGPCFSGNTLVITKDGLKPISDITPHVDEVLTQRGWRLVHAVVIHQHEGPMCDMGNEELSTLEHRFWWKHGWVRGEFIFLDLPQIPKFSGFVFNLSIHGDGSDEEQCYTLANGWIAHNVLK